MRAICNALRDDKDSGHDDICTVLACVAAWLKDSSALSTACTTTIVDMLDEVTGQIEQDKIDQQAESAWLGRDDSWMARQDACGVTA